MRIAPRLTLLLLAFVTPRASAQLLDDSGFVPKTSDTRLRFWAIHGGVRGGASLAGASTQGHGALGVSRTLGMRFPLTIAVGGHLDLGAAQGFSQRLLGAVEVRRHAPMRDAYWLLRVAGGAAHDQRGLAFAAEASAGWSIVFAEVDDDPTEHLPRFWLAPELGVAWSPARPDLFARLTATMSF